MKIVIQRVNSATLTVDEKQISKIGQGLLVFVGFGEQDENPDLKLISRRLCDMRIFRDENDKMNLSVKDVGGEILVVSNFTLYADTSHGNRPNFCKSKNAVDAEKFYKQFTDELQANMPNKVQTGVFGAHMHIKQENDGPINIILEY